MSEPPRRKTLQEECAEFHDAAEALFVALMDATGLNRFLRWLNGKIDRQP